MTAEIQAMRSARDAAILAVARKNPVLSVTQVREAVGMLGYVVSRSTVYSVLRAQMPDVDPEYASRQYRARYGTQKCQRCDKVFAEEPKYTGRKARMCRDHRRKFAPRPNRNRRSS